MTNSACDSNHGLVIVFATDDGLYQETQGPEKLMGGNLNADSRWSNESASASGEVVLVVAGFCIQMIAS